ncbi:homoserine kinase [Peribacillus muralis]|uniref:homoserine kinase n=1 Tax=Peribacillus muralis TaxID=264697 RepID=UPI001F4DF605|nr:homoserine kinase [Peribacillus muralis]MCK1994297.1 homoserine kinase [Peribacillus muralis]MCK2014918.1 homoserine kinase [Peribacillus muralis]
MSADSEMFLIRVPASTANLGPGFDSIGLALGLYLELHGSLSDHWEVIPLSEEMSVFPRDDRNYIVQIAKKTAAYYGKELSPCRLFVSSEIPLARGLGSSASAIVAGIELANIAGELDLTDDEKNRQASLFEGHPDNAGASVYGGLVVGLHTERRTDVVSFPIEGVKVIAVIPDFELLTEDSRNVLPASLPYQDAIGGSAAANVLLAAVLTKDWKLVGEMMQSDRFHQPYRAELVPHLARIEEIVLQEGGFGTALSGAGPTVLSITSIDKSTAVLSALKREFPQFVVKELEIDNDGSHTAILSEQEKKGLEFL